MLYGAGTNAAVSALALLGFDYATATNAASHVSTYPLGGLSRIVAPIRTFRAGSASGQVKGVDARTLDADSPIHTACERAPRSFAIIRESSDGLMTVRFDSYASEEMRLEVEVVPVPIDLKDSAVSVPKVPRKYFDILEYGAAFFILTDKEDDKAQTYAELAKQQLLLMQTQYRSTLKRTDPNFGMVVPRADMAPLRRRFRYGYTADSE